MNGVKVGRGQYIRSCLFLAEDLVYMANGNLKYPSNSMIKSSIDRLVDLKHIQTEETKYGLLFTILSDGREETYHEKTTERLLNSRRTTGKQLQYKKKNLRKNKKKKRRKIKNASSRYHSAEPDFADRG
jgi:hypothetical protein